MKLLADESEVGPTRTFYKVVAMHTEPCEATGTTSREAQDQKMLVVVKLFSKNNRVVVKQTNRSNRIGTMQSKLIC